MAENKSLTPEQQLLKLIEESNKKAGKGGSPAVKTKGAGFSFPKMLGALSGRLSFIKRGAKKPAAHRKKVSVSIADVNRLLIVVAACLLIYVVFDATDSAANLRRPRNFAPPKDMKLPLTKEGVQPLKESSYYYQKITSRDIFKEGKRPAVKEEQPTEAAAPETSQVIQNLALVGISMSSNPDAIIEDKGQQKTFFVKRGQMVGEDVKVEAIFKDHVVVSFEDREYELR